MTTKLADARAAQAEEHAAKVRQLFADHPECAQQAIIIWPEGGVTLTPEHMGTMRIVGILEAAKFGVLMVAAQELEGE